MHIVVQKRHLIQARQRLYARDLAQRPGRSLAHGRLHIMRHCQERGTGLTGVTITQQTRRVFADDGIRVVQCADEQAVGGGAGFFKPCHGGQPSRIRRVAAERVNQHPQCLRRADACERMCDTQAIVHDVLVVLEERQQLVRGLGALDLRQLLNGPVAHLRVVTVE